MNRTEFLQNLSLEELNLVDGITHRDILNERARREQELRGAIKFKVGDCFKHVCNGDIYLLRITEVSSDNTDYFICDELQIFTDGDFGMYDGMAYYYADMMDWTPISNELFDKLEVLYNECVKAINAINTGFYEEICKQLTT